MKVDLAAKRNRWKIIIEPKKIIQVWVINWYLTRWPSKCKGFMHSLKDLNNHGYNIWIRGFWRSWISTMSVWQRRQWKTWAIKLWVWGQLQEVRLLKNHVESAHACVLEVGKRVQRGQLGHCTWSQGQCSWSEPLNWYLGLLYKCVVCGWQVTDNSCGNATKAPRARIQKSNHGVWFAIGVGPICQALLILLWGPSARTARVRRGPCQGTWTEGVK